MTTHILTQERLKFLLDYDSISGVFTRKTSDKFNRYRLGDVVGTLNNCGYLIVRIDGNYFLLHRLVYLYVYGYLPKLEIDHINGIRNDNRLCNLREATRSQNLRNTGLSKNNKSGFKGVYFDKSKKLFVARCNSKYLGAFESAIQASECYEAYAKKINQNFYFNGNLAKL